MNPSKLQQLINDNNDELERHATRTAKQLINDIVHQQELINKATARIVECRAELKALEIPQLDPKTVLGE